MDDLRERIREANPIAEVIAEKISLKATGSYLVGLCPFHNDQHKPNLNIFPETKSFFCFACGVGGDVFSFIMQTNRLTFPESLRYLAERKSIPFSSNGFDFQKEEKGRSIESALREAAVLYHNALPQEVRDYLKSRGLADGTIDRYLIGFCTGDTVFKAKREVLIEAGLLYESGKEYFAGFITFPHFVRDSIVYMSGRGWPEKAHKKLPKEKVPLNHLYYEDALRKPEIIIAEGEIDTLTLLQHGFNACGVLGTNSFKEEWADKFKACEKAYVSFDGDEAGREGNRKIAALISPQARIVNLPEGEDINDFFKTKTAADYQELLGESLNLIETKIKSIPSDTSRLELSRLLNPIIEEMAGLEDTAYGDALLNHFIKAHFNFKAKDIESYENVLKQARKAKQKKGGEAPPVPALNRSQLLEVLKSEEGRLTVNPAQDFQDGVMFFTVMIRQKPYLLTSRRELIDFKDAAEKGIILRHEDVSISRFSGKGIAEFLEGGGETNIPELYKKIHDYISRFIFFADTRAIAYLSLWVMGTYVFMIFRYYPYVWVNAEKSSGKTLLMEILAKICFNGELCMNLTESVIFHEVAYNMTTLMIDELEKMRKQDKDIYGAIMSVLNAGFSVSGVAKRMEKTIEGKFVVKSYPAYSPKMFAGINEIDDVLQDRTVRIRQLRKKENEVAERYKATKEILEIQREIRDGLYCFALLYGDQLARIYNDESGSIEGIEHLSGRELDLWEPIFLLANVIDGLSGNTELTEAMKALSVESFKEKQADSLSQNDAYQLYTVTRAMLADLSPVETDGDALIFNSEAVFEYFKKTDEFAWLPTKHALTRRLKRMGAKSEQRREGEGKIRIYIIDRKKVEDLCERHKI